VGLGFLGAGIGVALVGFGLGGLAIVGEIFLGVEIPTVGADIAAAAGTIAAGIGGLTTAIASIFS
jgi:hypothetical protein